MLSIIATGLFNFLLMDGLVPIRMVAGTLGLFRAAIYSTLQMENGKHSMTSPSIPNKFKCIYPISNRPERDTLHAASDNRLRWTRAN